MRITPKELFADIASASRWKSMNKGTEYKRFCTTGACDRPSGLRRSANIVFYVAGRSPGCGSFFFGVLDLDESNSARPTFWLPALVLW
jgi:hypothetical protein